MASHKNYRPVKYVRTIFERYRKRLMEIREIKLKRAEGRHLTSEDIHKLDNPPGPWTKVLKELEENLQFHVPKHLRARVSGPFGLCTRLLFAVCDERDDRDVMVRGLTLEPIDFWNLDCKMAGCGLQRIRYDLPPDRQFPPGSIGELNGMQWQTTPIRKNLTFQGLYKMLEPIEGEKLTVGRPPAKLRS